DDPTQPIEREFLLAPAWRALKARISSLFKRPVAAEREFSRPAEEFKSTARIFEPEPYRATTSQNIESTDAPPAETPPRQVIEESPNHEKRLSGIEKAGYAPIEITASTQRSMEPVAEKRVLQEA